MSLYYYRLFHELRENLEDVILFYLQSIGVSFLYLSTHSRNLRKVNRHICGKCATCDPTQIPQIHIKLCAKGQRVSAGGWCGLINDAFFFVNMPSYTVLVHMLTYMLTFAGHDSETHGVCDDRQ